MLTVKQKRLFEFIEGKLAECGIAPTYTEMMAGIGSTSKAHVAQMLACLEERGFIRRLCSRARGIEIVGRGIKVFIWDNEAKALVPFVAGPKPERKLFHVKQKKTRQQVLSAASRKAWVSRHKMKLARAIREAADKPDISLTASDSARLHTAGEQ